jgi:hypothetical protein
MLRQRVGGAGCSPAYPVETGVDDDPVQPRGGGCVATEGRAPTGPEGRQQRVLQGVGGLLAVAEGAHGDGPQPVAVPADELAERVGITLGVRLEELRVGHRTAFSHLLGPAPAQGRSASARPGSSAPEHLRAQSRTVTSAIWPR